MIADRYADALFQAAQAAGGDTLETVDGQLADIAAMLRGTPELDRLWRHPVIAKADKQAMARQLLGGKVNPLVLNTLLLLFDKKRGNMIAGLQLGFRERFNATRRRATVKVTAAMPLDDAQTEQLRHQLSTRLQKEILMETAVDPTLIGGLVMQIEDQVVDNSLRGRLATLRQTLN